ncbi:glycosyltransferase family A protein [Massilia sp. CF038]|uniref:glycosyltransferase family A protein n=1 Tax=Massilia sp. CF038 TaxID=1881045 RepID=UPI00092238BD|nr:glycosyltransferase family A protein [Massilia sp. CF038]SHH11931.1 Glycosyl transferase family 2 [Massilia sp. CF038]
MTAPVTISVIVPAYNVAGYVGAALDSLLAQSVPFHEIIIIDDGSTDATPAVLERYRAQPGVRIERVVNGGLGRARNLGMTLATGDFVYFFDSDDLLVPTFGARMQALLAGRPEVDIVYFSGLSFLDEGCTANYLPAYRRGMTREFASGVAATGAMLQAQVLFSSACLYVSRRTLWADGALAFAPIVHEDEELLTVLSCKARVSLCIDDVLFDRRVRADSIMTQAKTERHALGYLHTLATLAGQCRAERARLAPIMPQLVRRFYALLRGYLVICKANGVPVRYRALAGHVWTLRRLPTLRQLVEMTASPDLKARLSRLRKSFTLTRTGQH